MPKKGFSHRQGPKKMAEITDETEKVVDIITRKKITGIPTEDDTKPAQFLNTWKKFCKDTKVKTVMIVTIDESDYCTWGLLCDDDHHLALAALTLEDLREEIKQELFGEIDLEEE